MWNLRQHKEVELSEFLSRKKKLFYIATILATYHSYYLLSRLITSVLK